MSFNGRVAAAQKLEDREHAVEWSKQSAAFWKRLVEEHPDLPQLRGFLEDAVKSDAELGKWAATQPGKR
jgi:hypothetical protein